MEAGGLLRAGTAKPGAGASVVKILESAESVGIVRSVAIEGSADVVKTPETDGSARRQKRYNCRGASDRPHP